MDSVAFQHVLLPFLTGYLLPFEAGSTAFKSTAAFPLCIQQQAFSLPSFQFSKTAHYL